MRPVTVQVGPLATANASGIGSAAAGVSTVTISNGTLDTPRRVLITPTGVTGESSNVFTIVGTNASGMPQTEVLNGAATAFYTNLDFATVISITSKNNIGNTGITVGTNSVASSPWVRLDDYSLSQTAIQCTVSGTATYTIQQTLQDPNSPTNPVAPYSVTWLNSSDSAAVNATTSIQSSYQYSPAFAKVTLTSGTGSVTATFTQFGVAPY